MLLQSPVKQLLHYVAAFYLVGVFFQHFLNVPLNEWMRTDLFVEIPFFTLLSIGLLMAVRLVKYPRAALWLLSFPFLLHVFMLLDLAFDWSLFPAGVKEPHVWVNLLILILLVVSVMQYDDWFRLLVLIGTAITFFTGALFNVMLLDGIRKMQTEMMTGSNGSLFAIHFILMLLAASIGIDLLIRCVGKHTEGRRFESRFTRVTIEVMFVVPFILLLAMLLSVQVFKASSNLELYLTTIVLTTGPFVAGIMVFMEQRLWFLELTSNEAVLNKEKERLLNLARQQRSELILRKEVAQITSHHLRGPSSAILKLSEELMHGTISEEEQGFYHTQLLKNAQQNMDTINDLAFLFNSLRRSDFVRQVVDVQRLFREEFNRFRATHEVVARLQMDLDFATINYSLDHLRGLARILLSNAFQFHHPNRHLVVTVRYTKTIDHAILEVEDNGIGFDVEKESSKVFQYGYKLDQSTENRGTGLFLARGVLELTGDEIEIDSKPNEGTVVTMKLRNT